jgi:hypothetical protein
MGERNARSANWTIASSQTSATCPSRAKPRSLACVRLPVLQRAIWPLAPARTGCRTSCPGWPAASVPWRPEPSRAIGDGHSSVSPSFAYLIHQRLRQIRQHRAVTGLEKGVDRHAGHEPDLAETGALGIGDPNTRLVEAQARLRILRDVSRNAIYESGDLRRRALIQRREADLPPRDGPSSRLVQGQLARKPYLRADHFTGGRSRFEQGTNGKHSRCCHRV